MASCTSSVLNRLRFTHLLNMQLSLTLLIAGCVTGVTFIHCNAVSCWYSYPDRCSLCTYLQWSRNLELVHLCNHHANTILGIFKKLPLNCMGQCRKNVSPTPTGTRRAFARKKGQQLCGSVKWKQPARTDVCASARPHVGKGFLKKSCGWNCRKISKM